YCYTSLQLSFTLLSIAYLSSIFLLFLCIFSFLIFNIIYAPTTYIYTLSLHDALPICGARVRHPCAPARRRGVAAGLPGRRARRRDRKSTRLNSSHVSISYAVFCLKKKKKTKKPIGIIHKQKNIERLHSMKKNNKTRYT